jgi:hypothetical protein
VPPVRHRARRSLALLITAALGVGSVAGLAACGDDEGTVTVTSEASNGEPTRTDATGPVTTSSATTSTTTTDATTSTTETEHETEEPHDDGGSSSSGGVAPEDTGSGGVVPG